MSTVRILVIGGTGRIGREVLAQGLTHGHHLTAFVRSPEKLGELGENLTVVRGDPREAKELAAALAGQAAVISVLGPSGLGKTTILRESARALVEAASAKGPARVLWVSAAMLFPDSGLAGALLRTTLLRNVAADTLAMEREVLASALAWTVVRPPRLTLGPRTAQYQVADGRFPAGRGSLARADVAHFLLEEVEHGAHLRQIVGLAG